MARIGLVGLVVLLCFTIGCQSNPVFKRDTLDLIEDIENGPEEHMITVDSSANETSMAEKVDVGENNGTMAMIINGTEMASASEEEMTDMEGNTTTNGSSDGVPTGGEEDITQEIDSGTDTTANTDISTDTHLHTTRAPEDVGSTTSPTTTSSSNPDTITDINWNNMTSAPEDGSTDVTPESTDTDGEQGARNEAIVLPAVESTGSTTDGDGKRLPELSDIDMKDDNKEKKKEDGKKDVSKPADDDEEEDEKKDEKKKEKKQKKKQKKQKKQKKDDSDDSDDDSSDED